MLAVLGATVAVTQISSAGERNGIRRGTGNQQQNNQNRNQANNNQNNNNQNNINNNNQNNGGNRVVINGLNVLSRNCNGSRLQPHNGFEQGPRCINTQFGEVSDASRNPSLLITGAPRTVRVGQRFALTVSTRNLIRDRFLGAADGGYYLEASLLNGQGLQRGHFHTACRMLDNPEVAPNPNAEPAFFEATEDGGGGFQPDQVRVNVDGMPRAGTAQCAVWAGDGSHRTPMMERANQTPAFDVVRVAVAG